MCTPVALMAWFCLADSFVNSQEWTLSRSVPELKVVSGWVLCRGGPRPSAPPFPLWPFYAVSVCFLYCTLARSFPPLKPQSRLFLMPSDHCFIHFLFCRA